MRNALLANTDSRTNSLDEHPRGTLDICECLYQYSILDRVCESTHTRYALRVCELGDAEVIHYPDIM